MKALLAAAALAMAPACSAQMEHERHMHPLMSGEYGPYPVSREATGTAWQPDSTPHQGLHVMSGDWMAMVHAYAYGIYDHQGGPRGEEKTFSESMLMAVAQRSLGGGTLGLRSMVSLDPAMGRGGYPLLLQTGETADGRTPLIDRQHPHDLFMELAASYSRPLSEDVSGFVYFGLPGEPALGPVTFMHRASGMDNPEAPITHHWLDSTHITEGVATLGLVRGDWKLEGSAFRGREPDQYRWDIERPKLDSFSGRLSWNPDRDWALQASYGRLHSPEALEPEVNQDRFTASASWNWSWEDNPGQSTFAFGRNMNRPGRVLNAFLLESAFHLWKAHTFFAREERVEKDELFDGGALAGRVFAVGKVSLGYIYDFAPWRRAQLGLGGEGSLLFVPSAVSASYGSKTPAAYMLFARVKLI